MLGNGGLSLETGIAQEIVDGLYCRGVGEGLIAVAAVNLDIDNAGLAVHTVQPTPRQGTLTVQHQGAQTGQQRAAMEFRLAHLLGAHGLGQLSVQPQACYQHQD